MNEEDSTQGIGIASQKAAEPLGSHVGSKVLPITDSNMKAPSSSSSSSSSCDKPGKQEKEKEKVKGDKAKAMSRMKELLRWAAAAKTEKGVKFIGRKVSPSLKLSTSTLVLKYARTRSRTWYCFGLLRLVFQE